jgi:hypothetical protein
MDTIAMDALNRGWQLGFGTAIPRRQMPAALAVRSKRRRPVLPNGGLVLPLSRLVRA